MKKSLVFSMTLVLCLSISAVAPTQEHSGVGQTCQLLRDSWPALYYDVFGEDATIGDCASDYAGVCKIAQEENSFVIVVVDGEWHFGPFDQYFKNVGDCVSFYRTGKLKLSD